MKMKLKHGKKLNIKNFIYTFFFSQHISKSSETNLTIKQVNRMHSGVYTCIARTAREMKFNSTALKVLYPAEIDNQVDEGISGIYGNFVSI